MNWSTWVLAVALPAAILGVLAIAWQVRSNRRHYGGDYGGHILGATLIILSVLGTLIPTVQAISNHMGQETCSNWGRDNARPSKFVMYTFWSNDCVTPDGHGKWIPTTQIIVNIPKGEN